MQKLSALLKATELGDMKARNWTPAVRVYALCYHAQMFFI